MIDLHLNHGNSHEGVYLRLPATPGEIGAAFGMLEKLGEGKVSIVDVTCPIRNITQYIIHTDISGQEAFAKLQRLAENIDGMDRNERRIFSGALDAESVNGLDDVLEISGHLERYVFLQGVTCDKELGGYLVESGYKDFPEHVRPYLDYAGIGAEYYAERGGAYTSDGYVLRREAYHVQTEQAEQMDQTEPVIRLYLRTASGSSTMLTLPATEEQVDTAKRALRVEELASAQIIKAEMHHYLADLIPHDSICVEDANELALAVEEMLEADDESLSKFLAVLTAEKPDTFPSALRLAMDQDNYELVPDDPWAYGEYTLRRVCQDQEVLDTIDGFMDYKALGEFQMKEDGVRETEYGTVVRLNDPFPQQERGQQMFQ